MESAVNQASIVVWGGLVLGFVFGGTANKSNFCTMGAISDVVNMEHWGRMRMWLLTMAVAILGTSILYYTGQIDITKTVYQRPSLPVLSLLVGGLVFGVGMTMAGGCVNKNLIRIGGGSLRSVVVLVIVGLSGYMTLKGLFAQWRSSYLDPVSIDLTGIGMQTQSLPEFFSKLTGMDAKTSLIVVAFLITLALLVFVLRDKRFRANKLQLGGSIVLGLLVVAAWYLTGHLGFGENPETMEATYLGTNSHALEAMSFVAPAAYSLELLLLWTDQSLKVTFGIATAIGIVLGSFAVAIANGTFRWKDEGFASFDDLRSHLIGSVLMGFGGVTSLGCTVGQGVSGMSTLALGSFIVLFGIIAGAVGMMKYQLRD